MTSLLLFFVFDVCGAADLRCSGLIRTTVSIATTPDSVPLQSVSSCDSVTQMPQGNAHTATLDNATQAFNGLHRVAGCSSKADAACAINAHNAHYRLELTRAPILSLVVIISILLVAANAFGATKRWGNGHVKRIGIGQLARRVAEFGVTGTIVGALIVSFVARLQRLIGVLMAITFGSMSATPLPLCFIGLDGFVAGCDARCSLQIVCHFVYNDGRWRAYSHRDSRLSLRWWFVACSAVGCCIAPAVGCLLPWPCPRDVQWLTATVIQYQLSLHLH